MNDIPAFPRPHSGSTQYAQEGMTLRDYFAAKVMETMVKEYSFYENVAKCAYQMADEMMKAREA